MPKLYGWATAALCALAGAALFTANAGAHGDVAPQAVDTSGLPELGEEWLIENPWRDPDSEHWARAVEVGASGYNANCARCHGLGAVSGGLAPDLRYLEADDFGDEWYLERYQNGYTQGGVTKMPAFGELLGQEAAWAIRTYVETRPDQDSLDENASDLQDIKTELEGMSGDADVEPIKARLIEIAGTIETGSGAPRADSVATRAADHLDGTPGGLDRAVEALTIGLSAAQ